MTGDGDPFRHHPELRERIVEPLQSRYRAMTLARMDAQMMANGAPATWRRSDAFLEDSLRAALDGRWGRDLWVFAYGSLMWDPGFRFCEVRTAFLPGFRRRFCLLSELGRGTPEVPGLVAALDTGGACHGLVLRVDRDLVEEESRVIWRREMLLHAYAPAFVTVETPHGAVEALAFVVDPTAERYRPDLSLDETARYMATGVGAFGSSLAYLQGLIEQFEILGVEDHALTQLYDLARRMTGP